MSETQKLRDALEEVADTRTQEQITAEVERRAAMISACEEFKAAAELAEWHKLKDPQTLYRNLVGGFPARLTREQLMHLLGEHGVAAIPVVTDSMAQLMEFYSVETVPELVEAQAKHIEKLQEKLPALPDAQPAKPRLA